jgi:hypothetical protein
MSMHVTGFRNLDGKFEKMLAAKRACDEAGIAYPADLVTYFASCDEIHPETEENHIIDQMTEMKIPFFKWSSECQEGFEVDVETIPEECKKIRFYCSY